VGGKGLLGVSQNFAVERFAAYAEDLSLELSQVHIFLRTNLLS